MAKPPGQNIDFMRWLWENLLGKYQITMKNTKFRIKAAVLIEHKNKLLLIKELDAERKRFYWNTVKGTFNAKKDKTPMDTAIRECKEEAGVVVKIERLDSVYFVTNKKRELIQFNFIAGLKSKKIKPDFKIPRRIEVNEEIREIRLFSKNELRKMKITHFINKRAYLLVKNWINARNNKTTHLPHVVFVED